MTVKTCDRCHAAEGVTRSVTITFNIGSRTWDLCLTHAEEVSAMLDAYFAKPEPKPL